MGNADRNGVDAQYPAESAGLRVDRIVEAGTTVPRLQQRLAFLFVAEQIRAYQGFSDSL